MYAPQGDALDDYKIRQEVVAVEQNTTGFTRILDRRPTRVWACIQATGTVVDEVFLGADNLAAGQGKPLNYPFDGGGSYLKDFYIDANHPWGGEVFAAGIGGAGTVSVIEVYV